MTIALHIACCIKNAIMHQNKRSNENIINVKQFSLEHHIYLNKELHVFNINVKSSIGAENVFS